MKYLAALFILLSSVQAASALEQEFHGNYPIKVVATVGMISDLLVQIGGEQLKVTTLIGSGGDPHLYKPSPKDMLLLTQGDAIYYNGLFLEGKMADILAQYSKKKFTVAVGERIEATQLLKPTQFEGHFDPHIWMDVRLWMQVAETIRASLIQFDPSHRSLYDQHFQAYQKELAALDLRTRQRIASIPEKQRVLVTAHDAFNYFSRAYGIEVRGIQGISTESEAGLKDINVLVDFLVQRNIPAVFVESSVSQKNVMALVEGSKSRGHALEIGGELFSDAMGAPETPDGTYIGMIDHNARIIAKALGGKP